ncbi:DUF488 domain-containing protein [Gracilibacillus orientalis]|uniref:DUF488 domain-containing protein n=1 Tax=Gracilibacillus orientalis TaxID=334253 RepID=UPI000B80FF39|nr:DUF488 family protein [Gracilibacillus orientalis]
MFSIHLKRVYDEVREEDGFRILVDRVWPRGVSKDRAQVDVWLKEIGPSPKLRKWFHHDPAKFEQFKQLYLKELKQEPEKREALDQLCTYYEEYEHNITLVYAAKEQQYNHVVILTELIT